MLRRSRALVPRQVAQVVATASQATAGARRYGSLNGLSASRSAGNRLSSKSTARLLSAREHKAAPRREIAAQPVLSSPLHSFAPRLGLNSLVSAAQNGILESDDLYRNGMPMSKFALTGQNIEQVFKQHQHVDPFDVAAPDVRSVGDSIKSVVNSDLPVLQSIAKYFFEVNGKRVRPTIVLLLSRAMSMVVPPASVGPLSSAVVTGVTADSITPAQRQLSEITEMIHTASLLHDDVIDEAGTRRGVPSLNASFGNKLAILGGDFLLARASIMLARLRDPVVIELLSTVIEHLVKGEVMQMKPSNNSLSKLDYYLTKTYYKTASLIANSCKAVAILGGHNEAVQDIAFEYGKNIGLAFQIVDDVLDFTGSAQKLGKAAHADLEQGIATVPVLYAAEEFPQLKEMIDRRFSKTGDVQTAIDLVERSAAIERANKLARQCGESAVAAVMQLPPSVPRSGLIMLVRTVLNREK